MGEWEVRSHVRTVDARMSRSGVLPGLLTDPCDTSVQSMASRGEALGVSCLHGGVDGCWLGADGYWWVEVWLRTWKAMLPCGDDKLASLQL